ncbi:MAG: hypothetical protein ACK56I_25800, partial [bacterium]
PEATLVDRQHVVSHDRDRRALRQVREAVSDHRTAQPAVDRARQEVVEVLHVPNRRRGLGMVTDDDLPVDLVENVARRHKLGSPWLVAFRSEGEESRGRGLR